MNILLLNQFCPPDVAPTGRMMLDLGRQLAKRGHSVSILCSRHDYACQTVYARKDEVDGVAILRIPSTGFGRARHAGRLADYVSFMTVLLVRLLVHRPRPDVILSLTTPPYLGFYAKLAAAVLRCRHAHWIMDLYPDVLIAYGLLNERGIAASCLRALTKSTLRDSLLTLTIGPDMEKKATNYTTAAPVCIPLWGEENLFRDHSAAAATLRQERNWADGETVFMYSGNMGLGHIFDDFLEAVLKTQANSALKWVFAGGGKRRPQIEKFAEMHPQANIELRPYAEPDKLAEHLAAADVHLASLAPAWQGCMVPSKVQGSFASGRPVIFVGPDTSSIAQWIKDANAGWVVSPGNTDEMLHAVDQASRPDVRREHAERARNYARVSFSAGPNCDRICELLEKRMGSD